MTINASAESQAAYGIPDWIRDRAYAYLDEPLKDVLPEGFSFVYDLDTPSCRLLNQPYDPDDLAHTQHYVIDGFIVSSNVILNAVETLDLLFVNSDHNPVCLNVTLG